MPPRKNAEKSGIFSSQYNHNARLTTSGVARVVPLACEVFPLPIPKIIAERIGDTVAEVREMRMQYRYDHGLAKRL